MGQWLNLGVKNLGSAWAEKGGNRQHSWVLCKPAASMGATPLPNLPCLLNPKPQICLSLLRLDDAFHHQGTWVVCGPATELGSLFLKIYADFTLWKPKLCNQILR